VTNAELQVAVNKELGQRGIVVDGPVPVQVLDDNGDVFNILSVEYDVEDGTLYLRCELAE
jgi:hypothetical protein